MKSEHPPTERSGHADEFHADIVELMPLIRRVVKARIRDPHLAEDLVQETLRASSKLGPESPGTV